METPDMKHLTVLLSSLLFVSIILPAQTADPAKIQTFPFYCPVGMRAQQTPGGELLAVRDADPKEVGQAIRLFLANPDSRQIVGARITVRGLSAKSRVVQALSGTNVPTDAAKAMTSVSRPQPARTFSQTSGRPA
jgi:hypothetical protein